MKKFFTVQKDKPPSMEQAKIVAIDRLKGRVSLFMRNGLVSAGSYLYDLAALRVGMSVLVARVSNSYVIIDKVSNMPRTGQSFSLPQLASLGWGKMYSGVLDTVDRWGSWRFALHDGKVYAGIIGHSGTVVEYDGSDWRFVRSEDFLSGQATGYTDCVLSICSVGGNLYICGYRVNVVNNRYYPYVKVWDGVSTWTTIYEASSVDPAYCKELYSYGGYLYMAMTHPDYTGVSRYVDGTWESVLQFPDPPSPGLDYLAIISPFVEYQGKLYIQFHFGTGHSGGNFLCKLYTYDGTSWTSIDWLGGVSTRYAGDEIGYFAVYRGLLYAGIDGSPEILVYDGSTWSYNHSSVWGEGGIEFDSICSMEVYQNKLYVGLRGYSGTYGAIYQYDGYRWVRTAPTSSQEIAFSDMIEYDSVLMVADGTNEVYGLGQTAIPVPPEPPLPPGPSWRHEWALGVDYVTGDVCYNYNQGVYLCTADHTSTAFTEPAGEGAYGWTDYWELSVVYPYMGEWVIGAYYAEGGLIDTSDDDLYVCIQGHESDSTTQPGVGVNWEAYWMFAM